MLKTGSYIAAFQAHFSMEMVDMALAKDLCINQAWL